MIIDTSRHLPARLIFVLVSYLIMCSHHFCFWNNTFRYNRPACWTLVHTVHILVINIILMTRISMRAVFPFPMIFSNWHSVDCHSSAIRAWRRSCISSCKWTTEQCKNQQYLCFQLHISSFIVINPGWPSVKTTNIIHVSMLYWLLPNRIFNYSNQVATCTNYTIW